MRKRNGKEIITFFGLFIIGCIFLFYSNIFSQIADDLKVIIADGSDWMYDNFDEDIADNLLQATYKYHLEIVEHLASLFMALGIIFIILGLIYLIVSITKKR